MKKIFLIFLYLFAYSIFGQNNQPPVISSEGNSIYCPQTQQNIVTSFNIEDPDDDTLDALYIQISEGYSPGEDQLIYNGSNPDLNTSWNVTEGKLEISSLSGEDLPISDIIDAVYEVVFFSSNPNPSDKSFSFTIGDANYLPSTGHYYVYFEQIGITWIQAQQAAENSNYYGLQGYLVTILSEEENQISAEQAGGAGWIGASDQGIEGNWNWITGPEGLENAGTGLPFWVGQGPETGGGPVNGMYSNWNNNPSEPNQAGDEDYAHITDDSIGLVGSWNDLTNTGASSGPYQPKGYVVEYGGMPGDPELNLSSSTNLSAPPTVTVEPFFGVDCALISMSASSDDEDGSVYWFEAENGGDSIFYGTSFEPGTLEAGNYSYWVSPFENGECDTYNRIEIQAVITPGFPEIVTPNVTVDQECYTVEELVTDVLINNECANVSNITWSSGNDFGDVNGIAHFLEPSGGFPFSEGIILSSGNALLATGPNESMGGASSGNFDWPGDTDLDNLIEDSTNNASVIEFDFVPISNKLSFRFIMASEEYDMGSFECNYSDVFAFLLTDQNGVTTNLAVLPETDIPIAITNIHPDNGSCEAANPEYFHGYTPVGEPDIGYDGRTVPFIAQANVNIGETYHIKLAVADASDAQLDSAVFLEAGSFDLGINLGEDILIGSGNEECIGNDIILNTQIDDSLEETIFNWYKDGAILDDEDSSTLVVSETG
ncbi:MAG: choice-of-anchor L domain-containing protein, partial [Bacteroidota bacterium]|nr:choice-of-anchor L domain-containing protein [Bacteroidota bacterium]